MAVLRRPAAALLAAALLLGIGLFSWSANAAAETRTAAVFKFELLDTSLQDPTRKPDAEHEKRLEMITEIVRKAVAARPGLALVDTAPVQDQRAEMASFTGCSGCALKLGQELHADLVVTGFVHKISLLIIDMAVAVHDVTTGKLVEHASVSIRGDTDKSWEQGVRFLVENELFKKQPQ